MTLSHRRALLLLPCLLLVLAAGCSLPWEEDEFDGRPGHELFDDAVRTMQTVSSVRLKADLTNEGKPMRVDVRTDTHNNCTGTLDQGEGKVRFISTPKATFMKADARFWKSNGQDPGPLLAELGDRWARVKSAPEITGLCGMSAGAFKELDDQMDGRVEVGDEFDHEGHPVVEIGLADGSLLIGVDDPHWVYKVYIDEGGAQGTMTFSEFGNKKPIRIPGPRGFVALD